MTKKLATVLEPESLTASDNVDAVGIVALSLPVEEIPDGVHVRGHVNVQLDVIQRRGLRRLQDGLNHQNLRLRNGRHVGTAADAVRWLMEEIETKASQKRTETAATNLVSTSAD